MSVESTPWVPGLWDRYQMALDRVELRKARILSAFVSAGVPHALVGGQAVAAWVASVDPAAVRTTKDLDVLLDPSDLARARKAAQDSGFVYCEVVGVGMFLDPEDPNPRQATHVVWAGEKVKDSYPLPSPPIDRRVEIAPGVFVVELADLLRMKLMANRDQDRVHVTDMIDVGLVSRADLDGLPVELAARLEHLLTQQGK